jgi:DDE superfamily endonuclease
MALCSTDPTPCQWFSHLADLLDARSAPRLIRLFLGAVVAAGRRTVTSWLRAAGIRHDFRPAYTTVAAVAKDTDLMAARLAHSALQPMLAGTDRLLLGIDDTPTQRYGPHVEGADLHHNPTPGPAGSPYVYGHVWVVLALLARHANWGVVALPLLARLYVRKTTLPGIAPDHRPLFRTKLEMAVELVQWAVLWLKSTGQALWVVVDGAYAKAPFLKPLAALGVTVVSRLRKDAALFGLPDLRRPGQRGRPRLYGRQRLDLAKRAGQRRGWQRGVFDLYGKPTIKVYKTFPATWRPAGGLIRVVLVKEARGWVAFFCTNPDASVADVLEAVADRFSLETAFRDLKEVVGAGQQQVRFIGANIGAFHLCLWTYTMTEAWAWNRADDDLAERSASPWDDASRRPSHADKRRAWRRQLLGEEITTILRAGPTEMEIDAAVQRFLQWAA